MNKNIKIILNYFIGPLVFLLLSWFIWWQVIHQPDWRGSLDRITRVMTSRNQWRLWLVVALMPLNWGIEARKWQLALRRVGGIAYGNALKAIFTGATMASFTPNRMGEYLGRMLYVKKGKRLASISLTIVCSVAQLLTTLTVGIAGLLYLRYIQQQRGGDGKAFLEFWINGLLSVATLLLCGLAIIYFRLAWVMSVLRRIPRSGKLLAYIKVLESFDATILLRILFLSFARYLVFIVQYGLIFPLFGVGLSLGQTASGMSVVFLVMALVPTFTFLTELGLRWETSIQALELFSTNTVGVFASSFAIWLINLVIPALIGSLLILSIKLFKNK